MKISARNQLKGKVVSIESGSVNAIVHLDIVVATLFPLPSQLKPLKN